MTNVTQTQASSSFSPSSRSAQDNIESAAPYTPFSPFHKKSKPKPSREYITTVATSDSSIVSPISHSNSNPYMQLSFNGSNSTLNMNMNINNRTHIINHDSYSNDNVSSKTGIVASPDGMSIQLTPESPHVLSPKKMLVSDSTTISPIFRNDVRQEWINAMFGVDFFPNENQISSSPTSQSTSSPSTSTSAADYTPPRQGVGLANVPFYLSYTATIPPAKEEANAGNKVGMTLSRIPIGVYVRLVNVESEAYAAGIVPGSVLIDINGMGVLGEPSHKLLERLWKFEGHFDEFAQQQGENVGHGKTYTYNQTKSREANDNEEASDKHDKNIIVLKLIKDGVVYSALLMTGTPFGISWAPCGNFALVQRTYAMAQKAGVRRGCILAAVNDKSLRQMNHLDTAMHLKDQFDKGLPIRIVCVYTPAASRTGHHERKNSKANVRKQSDIRMFDGVRVRKVSMMERAKNNFRKEQPTEYGVGSFFTCGTGINYQPNSADTSLSNLDIVMEIANRVAAGEIAAPTGHKYGMISSSRRNENNHILTFSNLVSEYMSETNSIQEQADKEVVFKVGGFVNTSETIFPKLSWFDLFPNWDTLESLVFCLRIHTADYCEEKFYEMGGVIGATPYNNTNDKIPLHSREANTKLIKAFGSSNNGDAFALFLLQLVGFISSKETFERTLAELFVNHALTMDTLSGSKKKDYVKKLNMEAKEKTELLCDEIIEAIVTSAIGDDSLCQSFHFLLRSFSSTIVRKKVDDDDDSAYAPIKMLTSAHCLLRNRLLDRDAKGAVTLDIPESERGTFDQPGLVISRDSNLPEGNGSMESTDNDKKSGLDKKKKKKFGKLFRRGSKKGSLKDDITKVSESCDSTGGIEQAKTDATRRKSNFIPNSILRKSADQDPQANDTGGKEQQIIDVPSTAMLFENMGWFLSNLDQLCGKVEDALLKSFSQKLTEWALQPWNDNKDRALSDATADMRNGLNVINLLGRSRTKENGKKWAPVINPVNSTEYLMSIIPEESYILPSAHFPLLLTFGSCTRLGSYNTTNSKLKHGQETETFYRTIVKINVVRGKAGSEKNNEQKEGFAYIVHANVGGSVKETGKSTLDPYYDSSTHRWHDDNNLEFETSSSSGYPGAITLRLSSVSLHNSGKENITLNDENGITYYSSEVGFSFIELGKMWTKGYPNKSSFQVDVFDYDSQPEFDQQGLLSKDLKVVSEKLSIELEVTTEAVPCINGKGIIQPNIRKQILLYKHDEDMRQEMLATQFLDVCDRILKASGLDLKIKKYKCIPVGEKKGFIEWIPGAFSLSELCKPMSSTVHENNGRNKVLNSPSTDSEYDPSSADSENIDSAFIRTGSWCQFESLRSLRHTVKTVCKHGIGISGNNPVQDFFRSYAYDPNAPYLIQKEVMDNFVKSCAGYSVITYLLGVGDRHTDNLLLHPKGYFLHCDYSFILGQDPKTYLPMRITEHMVNGMGGRDSDNFAMFLSLAGAAFVALRRHPSVRVLISIVRTMTDSEIPDIAMNQNPDVALQRMHERFRLDLNDDEAVSFFEENIERSISSKIWIAVDAIHSLGKRF